jgi:hypothetical protein
MIARRNPGEASIPVLPGQTLSGALADYDARRAALPWLKQWPMTIDAPACERFAKAGLWLSDAEASVPVSPRQRDDVLVLNGVALQSVTGLWDGRFFTPSMAETSIGRWVR